MNNESIALDSRNKTFKGMQKIAMSEQASGTEAAPCERLEKLSVNHLIGGLVTVQEGEAVHLVRERLR